MPPGQQRPVRPCQLQGDVRAGVPGTDDENVARAELSRVVVVHRVHGENAGIKLGCEVRDHRHSVEAGGHDDVVRFEMPVPHRTPPTA
jgi:hypothetical protein